MLQNAYFLAKIGFDTAENEPAINLQNVSKFANFGAKKVAAVATRPGHGAAAAGPEGHRPERRPADRRRPADALVERFDRRGIEPFELFTSEFAQRCVRIQEILLEN